MSNETRELLRICEQLPQAQRKQVANYARSLLAAATTEQPPVKGTAALSPLEALKALQASLALTPQAARKWIDETAERRAAWGRGG